MSVQTLERTRPDTDRVTWRSVAVLAAVLLVPALAYAATVLLPYRLSDLDELPLAELAGGADHLRWPGPDWLPLAGFAALLLAPLGALLALGGCALQLLAVFSFDRRTIAPGVPAGLAVVAGCALGTLLYFLSPSGVALTTWQLD